MRAAYLPPHQFNAIDTRSALKVDFWLAGSEPFDQEMLRRRVQATLFGEPAWISTAEDVILHKLFGIGFRLQIVTSGMRLALLRYRPPH